MDDSRLGRAEVAPFRRDNASRSCARDTPPCDTLTPRPSAIDAATGGVSRPRSSSATRVRTPPPHDWRAGPVGRVSGGNERRSARRVWRVARRPPAVATEHRASGCLRGASSRDRTRRRLRIASEGATPPRKRSTGYLPLCRNHKRLTGPKNGRSTPIPCRPKQRPDCEQLHEQEWTTN